VGCHASSDWLAAEAVRPRGSKPPSLRPIGSSMPRAAAQHAQGVQLTVALVHENKNRTRGPTVKPLLVVGRVGKPEQVPIYRVPRTPAAGRDLVKMPKALRAEINDVVVKYAERKLRKDGMLDVAMMAHEMTQSLVDMIMEQEEHDHAPLLALMILSLGSEYLQRTGITERRDN
jgi:hypothetical protein